MAAALAAVVGIAACGSDLDGGTPTATPTTSAGAHGHSAPFQPPPAAPLRAGERFLNLAMARPYTPVAPNGGTDEYRCFLIDPKLTEDGFLTGSQFLPQNSDIVHHAIFFRISPADVAEARATDARTPGDGWTCFGDSGIGEDSSWVGHWAPGANETLLTSGVGYRMPAGSQMVMQVHYNLFATGGKPGGSDQSGVRLRLSGGKTALAPLETALLPAPVELACASNESGPLCDRDAAIRDVGTRFGRDAAQEIAELNQYCNKTRTPAASTTQRCDHEVPQAATVYALAGHMHLLGRSIKVELNPGTAKARTLLDVPMYNFDDQAIRPLTSPVTLAAGDTLRVTCTHDVTLRQRLPQLRAFPARYVVWGDGTSDEMCLGLVILTPRG